MSTSPVPPGITSGPAFETSLVNRFNGTGNYNSTSLWKLLWLSCPVGTT